MAAQSEYDELYDPLNLISQSPVEEMRVQGQVINMIVSHSLEGEIYSRIGEYFTYCVSTSSAKKIGNLYYRPNSCQIKNRMRAVASFKKMAGFPKMSGYKQINSVGPSILTLNNQFASILDRMSASNEEFKKTRELAIQESPRSSYDLRKEGLFIRMVKDSTREMRAKVMNQLLAVIDETNFLFIDTANYKQISEERMRLITIFNLICSGVCFMLGSFMLVVTVSANIKDSMWELGVLRSMGCTRRQITRVMVYEMISNTLAALTLGILSGVSCSVLAIA